MSTCYDCQYWDEKTDLCKKTHLKKFHNSAICAEFLHIPACIVCQHFSGGRCELGIVDFGAADTIRGIEGKALNPETCICRTDNFVPRTSRSGNSSSFSGSSNSGSSGSSGCYVATAVYGSYDCPEVWTLRRFRDYKLAKTWCGRVLIRIYYAVSPALVKWFGNTKWFRKMWQRPLDKIVQNLQGKGFDSTPYHDTGSF